MSLQRLNEILQCIENQITAEIDYEEIIKAFSEQKAEEK